MSFRLFTQEWRIVRRDRSLWLALGLFLLLTLYGVYSGVRSVRFQRQAVASAVELERERWEELRSGVISGRGDTHPAGIVFRLKPQATLPPGPLASLAGGQSDLYPAYFLAKARSDQFYANEEIENPLRLLTGRLDFGFLLVYLYPLLVLAFTYNLLSSEREQGTLVLALSQPITVRELLLAKIGLRAAVILLATVGLSLVAVGFGTLLGGVELSSPDVWLRLAGWIGVVLAYGLFWFGLALLANALGRSSATNAMALGAAWILFVVIVPAVLNTAATAAYPLPSRVALIAAARGETNAEMQRSTKVLAEHYAEHPEFAPKDGQVRGLPVMTEQVAIEERVERLIAPVVARFAQQQVRREAWVGWMRYLSPSILADAALTDLAGTGSPQYRWFEAEGRRYRSVWREFFRPRIYRQQIFDLAEFDRIPRFHLQPELATALALRVGSAAVGMMVPFVLLGTLSLAALRKYSPAG